MRSGGEEDEGAHVDEATLHRLITEGSVSPPAGPEGLTALAHVLNAAAAPTSRDELAGEEAALAAFRTARAEHSPAHAGDTIETPRGPKRARITALSVILAALLGGGVATASGGLPFDSRSGAAEVERVPPPPTRSPTPGASAPSPESPLPVSSPPPGPGANDGYGKDRTDRPSLTSLCRVYAQRSAAHKDEALDSPALRPLVTAAGSHDEVDAYCTALLAAPTGADPSATELQSTTTPGPKSRIANTRSTR